MFVGIILSIVWDVDPEIFSIDLFGTHLPINWYGFFFALSFILGQQLLYHIFRVEAKPSADVDKLTVYVVVATIIGARLGHFIFYEWQLMAEKPWKWLITMVTPPFMGLASHGATMAILLSLYLYVRKRSDQSYWWILDRLVIVSSFGGLIRIGNLFNSEIYGEATDLPWGFVFLRETNRALLPLVPRHPTQLYEALFCFFLLGLTFFLWKYKRKMLPEGFITGLFLILLFSFRFLVEFLKNNQGSFEEGMVLNMGQLLSLPAILMGVIILFSIKRQSLVHADKHSNINQI
jgi:phosphatidylglycerol---prolipoprotein diacylglyceryl transferase